jgi:uncharacterized protein with GYD domain
MGTYITLLNYTDQGIRNVQETTKRAQAFTSMAGKVGVKVRDVFWTLGEYDLVSIVDAPDDETAIALLLGVGSLGNVRSQTLRAFSADEMKGVLAKMPKA